jgi:hypothetical protein
MNRDNVIGFPRVPRWSAARLAEFIHALDAFDTKARAIPGVHPEHADQELSDRLMSLSLAIGGELSGFFWPTDLECQYRELVARLANPWVAYGQEPRPRSG